MSTVPYAPHALRKAKAKHSTCLFHWRALDSIWTAITGQAGTFDRNGRAGSVPGMHGRVSANLEAYDIPNFAGIDTLLAATYSPYLAYTDGGVLFEDAGTNLALYSEDASNAAWTKTNFNVSTDTTLTRSPRGDFTADYLDETAVNNVHRITQTITIVSADYCTGSIFLKPRGTRSFQLAIGDAALTNVFGATFDPSTGTLTPIASGGAAVLGYTDMIPLDDGWFECRIGGRINGGVTSAVFLAQGYSGGSANYLGVVGSGLFMWGAQFLKSSTGIQVHSYVGPTSGSSVASVREDLTFPVAFRTDQDLTFYAKTARPRWAGVTTTMSTFPRVLYLTLGGSTYVQIYGSQSDPDNGGIEVKDDAAALWSANATTPGMPAGAYAEIVGQVRNMRTGVSCRVDFGSGFGAWSSTGGKMSGDATTLAIGGTGSGSGWGAPVVAVKVKSGLYTLAQMQEAF